MGEHAPPPSCALDASGLREQLDRYRILGASATYVRRGPRTVEIGVAAAVNDELVEELVAIERACCPFFALDWSVAARRLTVGVASAEHEPALDAVADALGGGTPGRP